MFKLLLLFVALALSLIDGAPFVGYGAPLAAVAYHEPSLATVGAVVRTIPTSVTHSSHAVVHKSSQLVQDIVAPVVRTTYTAPVSYSTYSAAPLSYSSYVSPLGYRA